MEELFNRCQRRSSAIQLRGQALHQIIKDFEVTTVEMGVA